MKNINMYINTINVYDGNGNLVAHLQNIRQEEIEPKNNGYLELIKHHRHDNDEIIQKIRIYAKHNTYISEDGSPCIRYQSQTYFIPAECYEIYNGKAQEPLPLSEVFEEIEKDEEEN